MKQLFLLKQQNRNFKTLLSIGGWTYSSSFSPGTNTQAKINTFVSTAVTFVKDLGFDGLDIDWEYPANAQDAQQFVSLLQALRTGLDNYATSVGQSPSSFLITVACPAGPANYQLMGLKGMDQYLDFWNLMAYDYAGSWSTVSGHDANLFPSTSNPASTPFNTKQAVDYYVGQGVAPNKIVLGCPLYGRAFTNTTGPGQPYNGVGSGSWEDGVWDWKALPLANTTTSTDNDAVASWETDAQNGGTGTMVSYDTMAVATTKADWVTSNGYGGLMWWESSADKTGTDSMIGSQVGTLGAMNIQNAQNTISYPQSQYENLRNGFQ